jgi:hypothetical protein
MIKHTTEAIARTDYSARIFMAAKSSMIIAVLQPLSDHWFSCRAKMNFLECGTYQTLVLFQVKCVILSVDSKLE